MLLLNSLLDIALMLMGVSSLAHLFFAVKALRLFEQSPPIQIDPARSTDAADLFETRTERGDLVHGLIFPPTDGEPLGVVVFCPEAFSNAAGAANYIPVLLRNRIAVVSLSFRSEGAKRVIPTDRPNHWCTLDEVTDTKAVLNYVCNDSMLANLPVALFGVSRGASAAIVAGAECPAVRGLVCQGAFSVSSLQNYFCRRWLDREFGRLACWIPHWHSRLTMWLTRKLSEVTRNCRYADVERNLPKWSGRPVMFISAGNDSYVPTEITRRLCILSGHDPLVSQWIVTGAKHNRERIVAGSEYDRRLLQFFQHCLKVPETGLPEAHVTLGAGANLWPNDQFDALE